MKRIIYKTVLAFTLCFITILFVGCEKNNTTLSNKDILTIVASGITLPSETSSNISLIDTYQIDGKSVIINWESDHEEIISSDGFYHIPTNDTLVTLTLKLSLESDTLTKSYQIKALTKVKTDQEKLQDILDTINIPDTIYTDIELLDAYEANGITATASWHSTDSSVITSEGVVNILTTNQEGELILTLSYNGLSLAKKFNFTIPGNTDLITLYAFTNSKLHFDSFTIKDNLDLPSEYNFNGDIITLEWLSSNESVLENDGTIHLQNTDVVVKLKVRLTLNYASREEEFEFTVMQNPETLPSSTFHLASVYDGVIADEAKKPSPPSIFPGAIYHKVVSSVDSWLGIEGLVTLPLFTPDEQRVDENAKYSKYLDNASCYMGGHAVYESDIGLSWTIGYTDSSKSSISKIGIAFRPFWRYITTKEPGYEGKAKNIFKNSNVAETEFYYYPGDTVRMSVFSPKAGMLQMRIELVSLTTIPEYVAIRNSYGLGDDFERVFITPLFPSEGMGATDAEFKRVNALDQTSNEGKATINTNARYENAIWHEVYLYRMIEGTLYKVPMNSTRSSSVNAPNGKNINGDFTNAFKITYEKVNAALGGEEVSICPNNGTGKLYN